MDYFAEIASSPDIVEALGVMGRLPEGRIPLMAGPYLTLLDKYPTLWRTELINWFYEYPDFAGAVWSQLQYARTSRETLARKVIRIVAEYPSSKGAGEFFVRDPKRLAIPAWIQAAAEESPWARAVWIRSVVRFHHPELDLDSAATNSFQTLAASMQTTPQLMDDLREALAQPLESPSLIQQLGHTPGQDSNVPFSGLEVVRIAELIADREALKRTAREKQAPLPFAMVLEEELEQIFDVRADTGRTTTPPAWSPRAEGAPLPLPVASPILNALSANLVGLALSGGGIRSATFNLGVLQALASMNVLRHCDYLSTVSGGGYIGAWFSAWAKRESDRVHRTRLMTTPVAPAPTVDPAPEGEESMAQMRLRLSPSRMPDPLDQRARPIRYLREFSNYLTPQKGFFSADTWTMIAIYFRNALLNLLVLIPLVSAVLLAPRGMFRLTELLYSPRTYPLLVPLLIVGLLGLAASILIPNLRRIAQPRIIADLSNPQKKPGESTDTSVPWFAQQKYIQCLVVIPLVLASWLISTSLWLWVYPKPGEIALLHWKRAWSLATLDSLFPVQPQSVGIFAVVVALIMVLFVLRKRTDARRLPALVVSAFAAGAVPASLGGLFSILSRQSWTVSLPVILVLVGGLVALVLYARKKFKEFLSDDFVRVLAVSAGVIAGVAWWLIGRLLHTAGPTIARWWQHLGIWPSTAEKSGALAAAFVLFALLGIVFGISKRFYRLWPKLRFACGALVLALAGSTAAGFGLYIAIGKLLAGFEAPGGLWKTLIFGTPLTMIVLSLAIAIQLGLLGANFPDEQREWWSRLRAWTMIYSVGWTCLFAGAIFPPVWQEMAEGTIRSKWGNVGALMVWIVSTIAGIRVAPHAAGDEKKAQESKSDGTNRAPLSPTVKKWIANVAPYIFIVGLVIGLSLLLDTIIAAYRETTDPDVWHRFSGYPNGWLALWALVLALLGIFVSWRIGVNEFSMHYFYKNRLVRCYLGASRWDERRADFFTGFDPRDDLGLCEFDHAAHREPAYPGAYPIVNAALNLVGGDDLAWQERKATSFVFTPKYCGYDPDRALLTKRDGTWPDGYAPTQSYAFGKFGGPTLGMAMAISGAAANPNMGRATSPASAFLMTVFNVRLGWWLPNPRRQDDWARSSPLVGASYSALELFGLTDDKTRFVNISDGGHFENLGIYELIRRGCRFIIASDAGQDGAFALEDLGNVIRKCRTDFGVDIEICVDQIRDRDERGWSKTHCVVGRIHYLGIPKRGPDGQVAMDADGKPMHEEGLLLYLKPSFTGDEPYDVLEYNKRVPEFPHETTGDQWFNESQFESYRSLGAHIAEAAFKRYRENEDEPINPHRLFNELKDFWYPPSPNIAKHTSDHTAEYSRIMELVRSSKELASLDRMMFRKFVDLELLSGDRNEFYLCNSLIQLMENVYFDLDLEQNYMHPHVEGWMSVFRSWSENTSFKLAWSISRSTYTKRFQQFYSDRVENGS